MNKILLTLQIFLSKRGGSKKKYFIVKKLLYNLPM